MNDGDATDAPAGDGWFAGLDPGDAEGAIERIRDGSADSPADWPRLAVEAGVAESEGDYYDRLREATIETARKAVRERERADDRQLMHAVRAMDDMSYDVFGSTTPLIRPDSGEPWLFLSRTNETQVDDEAINVEPLYREQACTFCV